MPIVLPKRSLGAKRDNTINSMSSPLDAIALPNDKVPIKPVLTLPKRENASGSGKMGIPAVLKQSIDEAVKALPIVSDTMTLMGKKPEVEDVSIRARELVPPMTPYGIFNLAKDVGITALKKDMPLSKAITGEKRRSFTELIPKQVAEAKLPLATAINPAMAIASGAGNVDVKTAMEPIAALADIAGGAKVGQIGAIANKLAAREALLRRIRAPKSRMIAAPDIVELKNVGGIYQQTPMSKFGQALKSSLGKKLQSEFGVVRVSGESPKTPSFKNTNEAEQYGFSVKDNAEAINELHRLRNEALLKFGEMKSKTGTLADKTALFAQATKAQLFREALQAAGVPREEITQDVSGAIEKTRIHKEARKAIEQGMSKDEWVNSKPIVYHGTTTKFEKFDPKYIGQLGSSEGKGFYFTNSKNRALNYSTREGKQGEVKEAYLDINNPITDINQKKITRSQLIRIFKELIKKDPDALSNYGDVEFEGMSKVLNEAVNNEYENSDSDLDLIASLINGGIGGGYRNVMEAVKKISGYDGVIADWDIGKMQGEKVYVAFLPEQIHNTSDLSRIYDEVNSTMQGEQPLAGGMMREAPKYVKDKLEHGVTITDVNVASFRMTEPTTIKDIHGNQVELPKGHEFTEVHLSNGKIWLHDGKNLVVSKDALSQLPKKSYIQLGESTFITSEEKSVEIVKKGEQYKKQMSKDEFKELNQLLVKHDLLGHDYMREALGSIGTHEDWVKRWGVRDQRLVELGNKFRESVKNTGDIKTKYNQWQEPGGENYREVLIKSGTKELPDGWEVKNDKEYGWIVQGPKQFDVVQGISREDAIANARKLLMQDKSDFRTAHWEEPNVIAHYRANDRVTPDGKKVVFLEEIQSDWAREAREKGIKEAVTELPEGTQKTQGSVTQGGISLPSGEYFEAKWTAEKGLDFEQARKDALAYLNKGIISGHPLLKNWQELALKNALKDAVESGADYLSWTTGEQQANRYSLDKYLERVEWNKSQSWEKEGKNIAIIAKKIGGSFTVHIDKNGVIDYSEKGEWDGKNISEVIGKGLAEKIMKEPSGELKGEGLKIPAEWTRNLYDKQIPSILKKLTGENVETITLPFKKEFSDLEFKKKYANNWYSKDENLNIQESVLDGKFRLYDYSQGIPKEPLKIANSFDEAKKYAEQYATDVLNKKSEQQAIRLTPRVKALVLGEQPMAGGKPVETKTSAPPDTVTTDQANNPIKLLSGKFTGISQEQFNKNILTTGKEQYPRIAVWKDGKVYAYDVGKDGIKNHADILTAHGLDDSNMVSGFINDKNVFVYDNPQKAYEVLKNYYKEEVTKPAATPEELMKKLEQLHKFGMGQAVPRKFGGVPKTAYGVFVPKGRAGEVKISKDIAEQQKQYTETLAHELGHAIHYNVLGTTKGHVVPIFGENLSSDIEKKIMSELKDITHSLVGEEAARLKPGYYYKPTELFARFMEKMMIEGGDIAEKYPTLWEHFEKRMIEKPILSEFLEAAAGQIDAGAPKFAFLRDKRQQYQKYLGKRVGDRAYDNQVVYRAMKERAKKAFDDMLSTEFKNVTDAPENLFRAVESIKVTKGGAPEFGTRDFAVAKNAEEAKNLADLGYEKIGATIDEGVEGELFAKPRYTPEEAEAIFNSLTPAGKELVKNFTAARDEAKSFFNRELIKEKYKVKGNIEGWAHRYWEDKPTMAGGKKLKFKLAGTRKQRTGAEGYVEDLKKSTYKALVDLETEKQYNDFVDRFFSMVSKPLAEGQKPDPGWVEVTGDIKKGIGQWQEKKTVVVDKDTGKAFVPKRPLYQIPKPIYDEWKLFKGEIEELTTAMRIVNNVSRYWKLNILSDPSSTGTNVISGAMQLSTKLIGDFVKDVLSGDMTQTGRNIEAMFQVITPKGWADAPDWVYGADKSNLYGQFLIQPSKGKTEKAIDEFGNKALYLFGLVERYFKKLITLADKENLDLKGLATVSKSGLPELTADEKEIIANINKGIDLFAYDYDNIPDQLNKWRRSTAGALIKPFVVWPYKAMKHFTYLAGSAFDKTLPIDDRIARLMSLALIVSLYGTYSYNKRKSQKTAIGNEYTPSYFNPRGRLPVGMDSKGREVFIKTTKYPFIGITDAGVELIQGRAETALDVLNDAFGGLGPIGELGLLGLGYGSRYAKYVPVQVTAGEKLASFVPFYRTLQNISNMLDPYMRKKGTFGQAFTSLIPTTDPVMQDLLHGEKRIAKVPIEGGIKGGPAFSKRTTTDVPLTKEFNDGLLYALTGILVKRIDPEQARAFEIRAEKNIAKKEKEGLKKTPANKIENQPFNPPRMVMKRRILPKKASQ